MEIERDCYRDEPTWGSTNPNRTDYSFLVTDSDAAYWNAMIDRLHELESNFGLNYKEREEYDNLRANIDLEIAKHESRVARFQESKKMSKRSAGNFEYSLVTPVEPARGGVYKRWAPSKQVNQGRAGYDSVPRTGGALVQGEMKYYDAILYNKTLQVVGTDWAATQCDPSSSINLGNAAVANPQTLCCPTVSAALNGRIGKNIKIMKIKVQGSMEVLPKDASNTTTVVRIALVQDNQTNGSQMDGTQLYQGTPNAETTIHAYQNTNDFGRFRVLKEKKFTFADFNLVEDTTIPSIKQGSKLLKFKFTHRFMKPVIMHFNATNGGTVADISDTSFHIIAGADDDGNPVVLNYYSRVSYKE